MTIWLHDRSGVIGTETSINIHESAFEKQTRSFKLFSLTGPGQIYPILSPDKLGFDTTIKLLVSPGHAVPSYTPNEDFIKAYRDAPHDRRWVITMKDGSEYLTVQTVSSVRAGFFRGRGCIV